MQYHRQAGSRQASRQAGGQAGRQARQAGILCGGSIFDESRAYLLRAVSMVDASVSLLRACM